MTWQVGKGKEAGSEEVARWERRVARWQGGSFLVLFKSKRHMVILDFIFLFLNLISNGTKEQDKFKII